MSSNVIQPSVYMTYMCHKSLPCEFCDITFHNCRFFGIPMDILPEIGSSADSELYGTIVSASLPGHCTDTYVTRTEKMDLNAHISKSCYFQTHK